MDRSRAPLLGVLATLALTVAAYARVLHGPFQFDDVSGMANPAVRSVGAFLRRGFIEDFLAAGRPLTVVTFGLNYAVGRLDPFGYHLFNLSLHLAVVALLWAFTRRLATAAGAARPEWLALGACSLFAVHPMGSQAVSYVSQRAEVLASAFYVITLLALLKAREGRGLREAWAWRAAAAAALLLGFASKAIAVTAPVAFLLTLATLPRAQGVPDAKGPAPVRPAARSGWLAILPIAALAVAFAAVTLTALRGRPDAGLDAATTTPWRYLLTQFPVIVVYLRLLAWPSGQCVDWIFPNSPGPTDPATLGAAAFLAGVAALGAWLLLRGRRLDPADGPGAARMRLAGAGLLWFFLVLSVTSSVVPLADNLMEHRTYLASWGIFLAVACGADALADRFAARRVTVIAWAVAVLALAAVLHHRNAVWTSAEALWADVLRKNPDSARGRLGLGQALLDEGRLEEAVSNFRQGLATVGRYDKLAAGLYRNLGAAHLLAGRFEEARRAILRGLELAPRDVELLGNMASLAFLAGDHAVADHYARRALETRPGDPVALNVLGTLALERDDFVGALALLDRAVAADPDRGESHMNRAMALGLLGRRAEECAVLRETLRLALRSQDRREVDRRLGERCR